MATNKFNIEGIRPSLREIDLRKNISIPSTTHGYSLAIEYMRNWIISKFPADYFKTVHINGKHVLADYRKFKEMKTPQIVKPALAIVPTINTDYNRDNTDLILGGLNIYTRRSDFKTDCFFSDYDNNCFIAMQMKQLEMPFNFKIRVKSRAMQLDLLEYTRAACRIGATQGEYIDIDCHVPYDIMIAIALDCGFEITKNDNGEVFITDIVSFLSYLNNHSLLYFTYKLRTANGKCEFFVRLQRSYVHVSCLDGISIDDGERINLADDNFHVEFTATLLFSVPAFFAYFTTGNHRIIGKEPTHGVSALYSIVTAGPPDKDEHNWDTYIKTQWTDTDKNLDIIPFKELFQNDELQRVLAHTIQIGLSPSIFMNMKLYNSQEELPIKINWETYEIKVLKHKVESEVSDLSVYVDLGYINTTIANLDHLDKDRVRVSDIQQ